MNLPEFLDMGKHAFFVWTCYGVTALFMIVEVILLVTKRRSMINSLKRTVRLNRE